jgi:hypothetical protein
MTISNAHGSTGAPAAQDATPDPEAFSPERLAEVHQDAAAALDRVSAEAASDLSQADFGEQSAPGAGS